MIFLNEPFENVNLKKKNHANNFTFCKELMATGVIFYPSSLSDGFVPVMNLPFGGAQWLSGRGLDSRSMGCMALTSTMHTALCPCARPFIFCFLVQPR